MYTGFNVIHLGERGLHKIRIGNRLQINGYRIQHLIPTKVANRKNILLSKIGPRYPVKSLDHSRRVG